MPKNEEDKTMSPSAPEGFENPNTQLQSKPKTVKWKAVKPPVESTPEIYPTKAIGDYSHIKFDNYQKIGQGIDGIVYRAYHNGRTSGIPFTNMSSTNRLAVKIPLDKTTQKRIKPKPEELEVLSKLMAFYDEEKRKKKEIHFVPMVYDEKENQFISPLITYNNLDGSDLQGFLRGIGQSKDQSIIPFNNTAKTLTELAISGSDGHKQLLDANIFHNDTATRNFLVGRAPDGSLKIFINDIGQSAVIPDGYAIDSPSRHGPVRYLNKEWLENGHITIQSQLYMQRAFLLEMGANMLGLPGAAVLTAFPGASQPETAAFVMNNNPEDVFKCYLKNLNDRAGEDKERGEEVKKYIACFADYLKNLPVRNADESEEHFFWRARQEDEKQLLQAFKNAHTAGLISDEVYKTKEVEFGTRQKMYNEKLNEVNLREGNITESKQEIPSKPLDKVNQSKPLDEVKVKENVMLALRVAVALEKTRSTSNEKFGPAGNQMKALIEDLTKLEITDDEAKTKRDLNVTLNAYFNNEIKKMFPDLYSKSRKDGMDFLVQEVNKNPNKHKFLREFLIQWKGLGEQTLKDKEFPEIKQSKTNLIFQKAKQTVQQTKEAVQSAAPSVFKRKMNLP